jgi:hypothetical protein
MFDDHSPNPNYGSGVFRRRIRLTNEADTVRGELEDCNHGFRVELKHDGVQVTAAAMQALRIPLNTCGEAARPLAVIVGCTLGVSWAEYSKRLPPPANCTHIHDLTWWALCHARRPDAIRQYDIAVTDETERPSECTVHLNGELVHHWQAAQARTVAPVEIADRPLFRGFSAWAAKIFEGEAYEAAVILQRGYFVAQARRHVGTKAANYTAMERAVLHGACYSYSPGAVERAVSVKDSQRDFTDTPERLLKFL